MLIIYFNVETKATKLKSRFIVFGNWKGVRVGVIRTHGQIRTAESKRYFREGLIAMLDELEPKVVLVYGAMPDIIFHGLETRTEFVQYPDWTTRMKQKNIMYKSSVEYIAFRRIGDGEG